MLSEDLKKAINSLRIWQRGDQRSPHKPLLFLYTLGQVSRGEPRKMKYELIKDDLKNLLKELRLARAIQIIWYRAVDSMSKMISPLLSAL